MPRRRGGNLDSEQTSIVALQGAGSIGSFLTLLGSNGLNIKLAGLCDEDKEKDWIKKLEQNGFGSGVTGATLAPPGFFVSVRDLEDELVRALRDAEVVKVREPQGEAVVRQTPGA